MQGLTNSYYLLI